MRNVVYFYDESVGNYYYSNNHPMKPHRVRLAHSLLVSTGMYRKMTVLRPVLLPEEEMLKFHADDYVHFLRHVTPDKAHEYEQEMQRYNTEEDNPIFDGLFKYCQITAGGSVGAAVQLNRGTADIAINWAGGMVHAKKAQAAGFGYINDAVLATLELLKKHQRVLYIDIDIFHASGMEEAFYTSDRVMTLSFHKFGDYFPGSGSVEDRGADKGEGYALNFPLRAGMDDDRYVTIFQEVVGKAAAKYQPGAIILNGGASNLSGDRLGCFNLTLQGHGACVKFVRDLNLPLLVLGGGGCASANVARCWANATNILLGGDEMAGSTIPLNEAFRSYYAPEYKVAVPSSNQLNENSAAELDKIKAMLLSSLDSITPAPTLASPPCSPATSSPTPAIDELDQAMKTELVKPS